VNDCAMPRQLFPLPRKPCKKTSGGFLGLPSVKKVIDIFVFFEGENQNAKCAKLANAAKRFFYFALFASFAFFAIKGFGN
jgi:hypothetical protein